MTKPHRSPHASVAQLNWRYLLLVVAMVLALYVVLPQIGSFRSSWDQLRQARGAWILVGAACYLGTTVAGTIMYGLLSAKRLPFGRTAIALTASSFANRLLPAGIGAMGVGYRYLRRQQLSQSQALSVVACNNLLGFVGNMILLLGLIIALPQSVGLVSLPELRVSLALCVASGFVVVAVGVGIRLLGSRLRKLLAATLQHIAAYRQKPGTVLAALVVSMCLTGCFAVCLWASSRALSVELSVVQALVVLTVSVAVSTVIPSPGGLGGAEAGLVAALVAYHIAAPTALAVALLYRLLTYWFGLGLGSVAFAWIAHKKYV